MASGNAGFRSVLKIGSDTIFEFRNTSFNCTRGEIEDTARDTDGWKSFVAGLGEWEISGELVVKYPASTAAETILAAFLAGTNVEDVQMTDASGYGWIGDVAITNCSEEHPFEDVVTRSVTMKGRGAPVRVTPTS